MQPLETMTIASPETSGDETQSRSLGTAHRPEGWQRPLSFVQERLLAAGCTATVGAPRQQVVAVRIEGPLDADALAKSFREATRRHEILRTIYRLEDGVPVPRLLPPPTAWSWMDLSAVPEAKAASEIASIVEQEKQRPLTPFMERVVRPLLLQLNPQSHVLLVTLHDLTADAKSARRLIREVFALYPFIRRGEMPEVPEPAAQYADFAAWQRTQAASGAWDEHVAFWREHLAGAPALLELPADRLRPAVQSGRLATETLPLPAEGDVDLRQMSCREGVKPSAFTQAALAVVILRYTRQSDVLMALPESGRDGAELRGMIGNFDNFVVSRVDLQGDPSVRELMERLGDANSAAMRRREVPFYRLAAELMRSLDRSYHPLAQVLFASQPGAPEPRLTSIDGLEVTSLEVERSAMDFDLSIRLEENGHGLSLECEYATDLFDQARIARMLGHLETLMRQMVANPARRISELSVATAAEEQRLLVEWNQTDKEFARDKTLTQLFEEQVARTPEAEALVCGTTRLTYRALHGRATRIAKQLRTLGVGGEMLVGICLERSGDLVAAILGTLQAGAAYVPLDPAYPKERLSFIVQDAGIRVLLTQRKLRGTIPAATAKVLCVEDLETGGEASEPPSGMPRARANDLAYVIYTSGSTGHPKGVALEHRGAVALACWARDVFTDGELSGVLAATSVCFDLSVFEIFVPLSWGGKVILADNALALPGLPAAHEVTLINTVPSAIRELLRIGGVPASVRVVNLAGEPLATALVDQIYQQTRVEKVYDLYGPTETTTYSTFTLRKAGVAATIGRPLANEQAYVLDDQLKPAPVGIPGELYLGGVGVARGYLNRPELTSTRFIANPFKAGERLYKTGDLVRWTAEGELVFLGRGDSQVKIRGFRIELGEIESVLKRHPRVRDAAVLAREDRPGDRRLAAYIVTHPGHLITAEDLRRATREKLPEYMVPSFFVFLDALPMTPNGKVDRRALPAPVADAAPSGDEPEVPLSPVAAQLSAIWSEILQVKAPGLNDNFFDLGGHSLLAIQVVSRIRGNVRGIEPPLSRALFEAPTISALETALTSGQWKAEADCVPPLEPVRRDEEAPASFSQERLWFLDQLEPGRFAAITCPPYCG